MTTMTTKFYPVGVAVKTIKPGDFILTETKGVAAKAIRFGQMLRYHGAMKPFARWNHAAIVTDTKGGIIEARPTGVSRGNISQYKDCPVYVVSTNLDEQNTKQVIKAAESFLNDGYGWFTIVSVMIQLTTGVKIQLSFGNSIICSALASISLWAGGIVFNDNPFQMMPADLAAAFEVRCIKNGVSL